MDEQRDDRPPEPGTPVGLGHVVDNAAGMGGQEPGTPDGALVEQASEDSFPASDPPDFMSDPAMPGRPVEPPGAA